MANKLGLRNRADASLYGRNGCDGKIAARPFESGAIVSAAQVCKVSAFNEETADFARSRKKERAMGMTRIATRLRFAEE